MVLEVVAGTLERDRQGLLVHPRQNFLNALSIDTGRKSSNTNIRWRILAAVFGIALLDVYEQRLCFRLESSRLNISATARTPPWDSRLKSPRAFSFSSMTTPAILPMISGARDLV